MSFLVYGRCPVCGHDVIRAWSERGDRMVLDAEPVGPETPNHFVLRGETAMAIPSLVFDDEPHYVLHNELRHRRSA